MSLDQFDLGMLQSDEEEYDEEESDEEESDEEESDEEEFDEEEHAEEEFDKEVTLYSSFSSSSDTYYICFLIHGQLLLFPTL